MAIVFISNLLIAICNYFLKYNTLRLINNDAMSLKNHQCVDKCVIILCVWCKSFKFVMSDFKYFVMRKFAKFVMCGVISNMWNLWCHRKSWNQKLITKSPSAIFPFLIFIQAFTPISVTVILRGEHFQQDWKGVTFVIEVRAQLVNVPFCTVVA